MIHKGTPWRPQKASQVTSSRATRHCLAYSSTIKDGKAKPRRKKNTIITGIIIIIRSHDYNQHSHHQPTHPPSYRIIPNTPHLSLAQTSIITKKPESESTASTTPAFLADTPNSKAQHPVNLTYLAPARPLNTHSTHDATADKVAGTRAHRRACKPPHAEPCACSVIAGSDGEKRLELLQGLTPRLLRLLSRYTRY